MSFRDQLLKKGLVSKKKVRQAERELKQARKSAQATRKTKRELKAEAEAAEAAAALAEEERTREARRARAAERDALERSLRVRNLILGNRKSMGRGQRFWHRHPDGRHLQASQVSSGTAYQLRCGELALAALSSRGGDFEVVAVPKRAAAMLAEIAPENLLFFVTDTSGLSAPDLAFHTRTWETELGPRRATEADVRRHQ